MWCWGLGAVTALLVLVFRDALLGLTASIQLSSADLARIGDWVEIQKYGADGTVVEINLTTVKVQNWDMTFTVVPTYALISDSFKNWRGMMESPGRRIKRSIPLRLSSVRFADARLLGALDQVQLLAPWLADRKAAIALHNETLGVDASIEINGRRLTNLGLFRNYLEQYLRNHPGVNQDMPLIVRHLQPTSEGIPLEFYCFANEKQWYGFEVLMADLMDHALAALPISTWRHMSGKDHWFRRLCFGGGGHRVVHVLNVIVFLNPLEKLLDFRGSDWVQILGHIGNPVQPRF